MAGALQVGKDAPCSVMCVLLDRCLPRGLLTNSASMRGERSRKSAAATPIARRWSGGTGVRGLILSRETPRTSRSFGVAVTIQRRTALVGRPCARGHRQRCLRTRRLTPQPSMGSLHHERPIGRGLPTIQLWIAKSGKRFDKTYLTPSPQVSMARNPTPGLRPEKCTLTSSLTGDEDGIRSTP